MTARLVSVSQPVIPGLNTAEELVAYVARVSNPSNQTSGKSPAGLLEYCIKNKHWSVFETATMTVELETTRAVAAQILRHRSFTFQEFSQRYAVLDTDPEPQRARRQDDKNRQASHDDLPDDVVDWWRREQDKLYDASSELYVRALEKGIARECARFVLPLATPTKMYMTGNVRDWIHYIELRTGNGTQREHAELAEQVKEIFVETFPVIAAALKWN
jgi:thymidylate synthase (FAD)